VSAQRAKLIEAGVELLERDGVQSLSARKFAAKRGTSTMAVYTHFGNIAGLLDVAAGRIRDDGSLVMAARLWTLTHGAVTLEMAGFFGNAGHGLTEIMGRGLTARPPGRTGRLMADQPVEVGADRPRPGGNQAGENQHRQHPEHHRAPCALPRPGEVLDVDSGELPCAAVIIVEILR